MNMQQKTERLFKMKPFQVMHRCLLVLNLLFWGVCTQAFAQTAKLQGLVSDAETREPLVGAQVVIPAVSLGALTDSVGRFLITDVPLGTYAVQVIFPGYQEQTTYQIRVEAGVNQLDLSLQPVSVDALVVKAPSFQRRSDQLVSTRTIGQELIQSNPGGNLDVLKTLQTLPGVTVPVGFRNDLIVRGGAPSENIFFLDGVEIPTLNHFATQGAGGGPVGILNAVQIQDVDFQSSGFSARYDNVLSSALDFTLKEGNRERFQTTVTVGSSEAGVTFDTPIGKKLTFIGSVRRSYLQFLFEQIGLPFLPDYWDFQGKLTWQLNERSTLRYVGVGAIDDLTKNDSANVAPEDAFQLDGLPVISQVSSAQGLVFKRLQDAGYYRVVLSRNTLENNVVTFRPFTDDQEVSSDIESRERENKLRVDVFRTLDDWQFTFGFTLQQGMYDTDNFLVLTSLADDSSLVTDTVNEQTDLTLYRAGAYGSVSRAYFDGRLRTNAGIRFDGNSFTDGGWDLWQTLSPRLSATYALTEKWAINASWGTYYKLPPLTVLGYEENNQLVNEPVDYIQSTHWVAGLEYQPAPTWTFTVEGFLKDYSHYPASIRDGISLANLGSDFGVFGNEPVASTSRGRAYGVEVFSQKRLTDRVYGLASFTWFRSEFTNPGTPTPNTFVRSSWDSEWLATFTGGYRFGQNRTWELATKLLASGPLAYTPVDVPASTEIYAFTGSAVPDYTRVNQEQVAAFFQLDVRLDKKWFFQKWSLNVFLDIVNVLDLANEGPPTFTLERNATNTAYTLPYAPLFLANNRTTRLPSIGLRAKF